MPWKLIQKTYGKDPRVDAKYHIKYQSSFLSFDLVCSYLNESYRWVLHSETLGVKGIILGESPNMTAGEAGPAAVLLNAFLICPGICFSSSPEKDNRFGPISAIYSRTMQAVIMLPVAIVLMLVCICWDGLIFRFSGPVNSKKY